MKKNQIKWYTQIYCRDRAWHWKSDSDW